MMKNVGLVFGVAAVATFVGCKDPNYAYKSGRGAVPADVPVDSGKVTPVPAAPADEVHAVVPVTPAVDDIKVTTVDVPVVSPVAPKQVAAVKPAGDSAAYTTYIVQRGDCLSKIAGKYSLKVADIRALNKLKNDNILLGQKLKLPGKVAVGEQKVPEGAFKESVRKPAAYVPYTGATVEYTVKSGDSLGAIAYGNGINIRQLKELNALASDRIRIGQKLKIPAAKVAVAPKLPAPVVADEQANPVKDAAKKDEATLPAGAGGAVGVEPAPIVEETTLSSERVHVVEDGEDVTGIAIRYDLNPSEIRDLNGLDENAKLTPGMRIALPSL